MQRSVDLLNVRLCREAVSCLRGILIPFSPTIVTPVAGERCRSDARDKRFLCSSCKVLVAVDGPLLPRLLGMYKFNFTLCLSISPAHASGTNYKLSLFYFLTVVLSGWTRMRIEPSLDGYN